MTVEVLAAIAQLCLMSTSGPLFPVKHEQLKCQHEYIKCFYKLYVGGGPQPGSGRAGDVLAACNMERQS